MVGRAVVAAAGAMLLSGAATAQTTEKGSDSTADKAIAVAQAPVKSAAKSSGIVEPGGSEPDPLTPPEVQAPPQAAPAVAEPSQPDPAPAAATQAAAVVDPVLQAVRLRLQAPRGREAAGDAADRAAMAAFYAADTARISWTTSQGFTPRAEAVMGEIRKADDWGLKAAAFDLPSLPAGGASEEARADAEVKLGLAALKYARHARGGRLDPSSVSKLFDRKAQVYEPGSLIKSIAAASAPDEYLRNLHPKHAGFRNLQKALVALLHGPAVQPAAEPETVASEDRRGKGKAARKVAPTSSHENVQRIVANMERWRWMPDDLGAFHVWNNIPDQITTVYSSGKVVFTEKIVVGKPDTATPNFSADMQFVIFQPEWGVPGGIKNNELAPMLRRASSESGGWFGDSNRTPSAALARHGLRVTLGNQVVNPDSINWSAVDINRFNFVQPGGGKNVLGVVKFRFPNKHDVYMHDTPERHLFSSGLRAFSHGCMRVQNPVRFAEVLLEHDKGWSAEKVRSLVPHSNEVKLTKQIPVHNVYFTAMADENGKVRVAGDIYGSDSRVMSALEGRSVAVASRGDRVVADVSGDGEAAPRVRGERPAKKQRGQTTASSQPFNPFSGLFGN